MSDKLTELQNRITQMSAHIQSLNQLVQELTSANVGLRANMILIQERLTAVIKSKKAEVPVPAAEPVPAEAAPAQEDAA
jgi:regulator of replication initiation timing